MEDEIDISAGDLLYMRQRAAVTDAFDAMLVWC